MNAARVLPAIRELFSQHPLAVLRCPEQIAALLWALSYVENRPDALEVEAALEVLDIERGRAA
jgi:hypothetical protein